MSPYSADRSSNLLTFSTGLREKPSKLTSSTLLSMEADASLLCASTSARPLVSASDSLMRGNVGGPGGIDFALSQLRLFRKLAGKTIAAQTSKRLPAPAIAAVSYTHLTLPTKRIV